MAVCVTRGYVDSAFRSVCDLFTDLVASGSERGAIAIRIDGRPVIELHGGEADPTNGAPWQANTLACCFSVSKGILSLLAHVMIDRGLLDATWPVARVWPAFAAQGKEAITIADILTHRAGLPAVSVPCARGDLYDWATMTGLLEGSAPVVPVGQPIYHNMTYGYLLGEVLSRAGARPFPLLLHDLLTGPLDADFAIGLNATEQRRTAKLSQTDPESLFRVLDAEPGTLFARSMAFFARGEDFNTQRWREAVIGSGSGHATAAALARLYGQLVETESLLSSGRCADALLERCQSADADPILGVPIRHALGFELSLPPGLDFGPNARSAGYWGAGGATAFANPDARLSFGYVTGIMAPGLGSSDRARALIAELYTCL